ncbi:hypothetical protein BN1723_018421, partial [Verticillium longisporum]
RSRLRQRHRPQGLQDPLSC